MLLAPINKGGLHKSALIDGLRFDTEITANI